MTEPPENLAGAKPRSKAPRWVIPAIAAPTLAAVAIGAWAFAGSGTTAASPTTPPPSTSPTAPPNPDATEACDIARRLSLNANNARTAAVARMVDPAARSGIFELHFAANMALDRAELADAAEGTSRELSTRLSAGTAIIEVTTVCVKAGY